MQFILIAHDKSGGLPLRMATRAAHLAYCEEQIGSNLLYAGPILAVDGSSKGSVLIIEAADADAAKALFAADPYAVAGLFEHTSMDGFKTVFRNGVLQK
jgi:uncharacterized protein YciI